MDTTVRRHMVVIDCFSLLFRAFYGGRFLSTPDGRPTGALYGFAGMLLNIVDSMRPDIVYAAWDAPARTFRHDRFDQYKAHRPEIADDLRQQIDPAHAMVDVFGLAAVMMPGYEADDLIGTLAARGVREGCDVTIITGDSDQLQLVGPGVTVQMTGRGVSELIAYDAAAVQARYGIPPERVPDYKALVGDTSDNIPGVPGIGDKTATKLLQEFGSLEGLIANVDRVQPERIRNALAASIDKARLSLELATIDCDVPYDEPLRAYAPGPEVWAGMRAFFTDLDFRSLLKRVPEPPEPAAGGDAAPRQGVPVGDAVQAAARRVISADDLAARLAECAAAPRVAVRLVTSGPGAPMLATLEAVAWACDPSAAYWVDIAPAEPGLFGEAEGGSFVAAAGDLAALLESDGNRLIGFHTKFDTIVLRRHGLAMPTYAADIVLMAYLLNPGRSTYLLDDLAQEHLGIASAPAEQALGARAAAQAALLLRLEPTMAQRIEEHNLGEVLRRVEMPLTPVLAAMEMTGVPVDREWLVRLADELGAQAAAAAERIYELAGETFTIGSTQQLQRVLFEKLKLPAGRKIKTGYSTGADLLEQLAGEHEIAAKVLEYRELTKLKSTYADSLPKLVNPATGRIHTSLNQTVASTGRLSSSDPNLQNIPVRSEAGRKIRKAFVAPPGQVLLSCDYSQIELRVFAHITRDPEMLRAFEADDDIHAATATKLFGVDLDHVLPEMRRRAKTVNFAVIYGQSDFGLAATLGIPAHEAKAFKDAYFAQFPGVLAYTEGTIKTAREQGYVETLMGRRRYLPEIASGNRNIRMGAERAAVNMPIQGTAADIMKLAMIDIGALLAPMCYNCALILQVHDELVFALDRGLVPELVPAIVRCMEGAYSLDVRLRVDAKVGTDWSEMQRVGRVPA